MVFVLSVLLHQSNEHRSEGGTERQRENEKPHEKWLQKIATDVDGLVTKISNIIQFSSSPVLSLSSLFGLFSFLFWPSFLSTSRAFILKFILVSPLLLTHSPNSILVAVCAFYSRLSCFLRLFLDVHRFAKHKVIKSKIQRSVRTKFFLGFDSFSRIRHMLLA